MTGNLADPVAAQHDAVDGLFEGLPIARTHIEWASRHIDQDVAVTEVRLPIAEVVLLDGSCLPANRLEG